tara:strand:+ start:277911 stop:278243 length:333 start_codon:yes stop_codon:yes gene_type:complete
VACVFGGESFALKDVTEMTATVLAQNFDAAAIGIRFVSHRPFDFVVKAGPTTTRFELIFGSIERRIALPTQIGTGPIVIVQFSRTRPLGALTKDDVFLFFAQWIVWIRHW